MHVVEAAVEAILSTTQQYIVKLPSFHCCQYFISCVELFTLAVYDY